ANAALPVVVTVTAFGVRVLPSGWLPMPGLVGANPTPGAVPFPLSVMICGLPPALSASDSVPVRAPEAVGVKVTLMVQFAPAAKVAGRRKRVDRQRDRKSKRLNCSHN